MLGRTLKAIPTATTRHMTTSISATAPGLAAAAASTATSTATPASAPTHSTHSRHSLVPVFHDLAQLRRWRRHARERGSVGVVPTMGALHDGHLELVRRSMEQNKYTCLTLFINPTQFAPHEDLASYPRTLDRDVQVLEGLVGEGYKKEWEARYAAARARLETPSAVKAPETTTTTTTAAGEPLEAPLIVFAPSRETMYPLSTIPDEAFIDETDDLTSAAEKTTTSKAVEVAKDGEVQPEEEATSMLQDTSKQRGAFVRVKGWGDVLEGEARPQFFQGVATVCTKLFNAVQPDHAYFGQKDIQQALVLKRMLQDLLSDSPSAENLHIIPTTRDATTGLALSSRNAYLTPRERTQYAPALFSALGKAREALLNGRTADEAIKVATEELKTTKREAEREGVTVTLDHVDIFEPATFRRLRGPLLRPASGGGSGEQRKAVVVGAVWVGRTRLIDNLLVGWEAGEEP